MVVEGKVEDGVEDKVEETEILSLDTNKLTMVPKQNRKKTPDIRMGK